MGPTEKGFGTRFSFRSRSLCLSSPLLSSPPVPPPLAIACLPSPFVVARTLPQSDLSRISRSYRKAPRGTVGSPASIIPAILFPVREATYIYAPQTTLSRAYAWVGTRSSLSVPLWSTCVRSTRRGREYTWEYLRIGGNPISGNDVCTTLWEYGN